MRPAHSLILRVTVIVTVLITFLCIESCGPSAKISNRNLAYLYSPGSNFIHPDYRVVNISPDTSRLFFRIPGDELLYMKSDTGQGFNSSFSVGFRLLASLESKELIDTGVVYFESQRIEDSVYYISDHIDFRAKTGFDYVMQVTITDHNKNQAVSSFVSIDRTGRQSPNNFLVLDKTHGTPVYGDHVNDAIEIEVISLVSEKDSMWLRYFTNVHPLPRPPFSSTDFKTISYSSDHAEWIRVGRGQRLELRDEGIYHFQYDTTEKEGLSVIRFGTDYPEITSASELIEPLRFLTTREEYDRLRASRNKKEAVDKYWLTLSGNRDRGRVLIRSYYSRVQFANRNFGSYLEGWKSDRGLIYIIFGPPSSVYISSESESWNYGQLNSYSSLIFTFDKVNNPFTNQDYHLRRADYYEVPWYRAVESWRSGRVVNDSY